MDSAFHILLNDSNNISFNEQIGNIQTSKNKSSDSLIVEDVNRDMNCPIILESHTSLRQCADIYMWLMHRICEILCM